MYWHIDKLDDNNEILGNESKDVSKFIAQYSVYEYDKIFKSTT